LLSFQINLKKLSINSEEIIIQSSKFDIFKFKFSLFLERQNSGYLSMFQIPSDHNPIFHFMPSPNLLFPQHNSPLPSNFIPQQQKKHSSGKKLNFDDPDEVIVSEFDFSDEFAMKSPCKAKILMEIEEEEVVTPQNAIGLSKESSMQTPQKNNKGNFPFLQVTVPAKYDKKKQDFNETEQKSNQNIIGYFFFI